jgi:hypothetical protein
MRRLAFVPLIGVLMLALIAPVSAQPVRDTLVQDIPVTGTLTSGAAFEGTLDITGITRNAAGQLEFAGEVFDAAGDSVGEFTAIVGQLTGNGAPGRSCDILFLDLGPIFLDVLGLQVNLSQIILDIDAVSGAGNLLGNLLCGLVGLLDGGGPLAAIDRLLTRIGNLL